MSKRIYTLSLLLGIFSLCACSPPTNSAAPSASPQSSASPSPAASASPTANASANPTTAPVVTTGKATLEGMKAASACLKASGATGASLASGIDARIAIAEQMIKNGTPEFAQGQLDLAYSMGNDLEKQYGLDCIK
ncbi:hypothetical protein COW36_15255 [bacterium (Candidatus Blackallbacteria) CG17_big_fil_post_rev_8_21_14_2_50_48_46]|uniref:Uncharacterized protein n=1 Tax=bacterium (Candidatus Blackallbacteria) CG17_big_fil_post_rev_8_21_14_2_50_48_46 TaxID=2014261 RepID=A0A2M7G2M4_9BACT|nr:MAG: hypothetical protein COW64_11295 [bacterium (Candidatus Blackallbacteria) CG18_big_fil_WC_8_21_14_2_50_49_26]PIW16067.1 MAG: hypothetical protein COW36_15255 [bacterium (Candidatus Blackallbacteria) CG17_big_fil_post_rev_8_21_14_2_50_48_46]PIW50479.1 MAG: hypothetical protein COW20_02970 [bacterium (Candidatus Blackallbacteria) CG13_big_fil_rev_8_21_14_2_50_49_14]